MLSEDIKKILNESYNGRQKKERYIVKLPCCNGNVELLRPEDSKIYCPKCYKTHYLIWSKSGQHKMGITP